jgi:hypothetical protein
MGAVVGAVAAGAVILGANAPAYAAGAPKGGLAAAFRASLDGVLVKRLKRVTFHRQVYAVLETPEGNTYTYLPLAFGDLDVTVAMGSSDMSSSNGTLPAWMTWFDQVRTGADSGNPRTLVVEALSANRQSAIRTWQLLVRPKRFEASGPGTAETTAEHRFVLRGTMGSIRP